MTDNQKARAWDALKQSSSKVALDEKSSEKDRNMSAGFLAMMITVESHIQEIDKKLGGE